MTKKKLYNNPLEYLNYFNKSNSELQETITVYLEILAALMHSLYDSKVQVTREEKYLEPLTFKFIFAASSTNEITKGTPLVFDEKAIKVFDISSAKVLLRSCYEAFLTYEYLFVSPENKDIELFRSYIYQLSGLISRQKFEAHDPKNNKQKDDEKKQILSLIDLIEKHELFETLAKDKQTKIKNLRNSIKRFQPFAWDELFKQSILKNSGNRIYWHNLSNHAHSEFISILQFQEYSNNYATTVEPEKRIILRTLLWIITVYIVTLKKRYKIAEIVFNTKYTTFETEIEFWNYLACNNTPS